MLFSTSSCDEKRSCPDSRLPIVAPYSATSVDTDTYPSRHNCNTASSSFFMPLYLSICYLSFISLCQFSNPPKDTLAHRMSLSLVGFPAGQGTKTARNQKTAAAPRGHLQVLHLHELKPFQIGPNGSVVHLEFSRRPLPALQPQPTRPHQYHTYDTDLKIAGQRDPEVSIRDAYGQDPRASDPLCRPSTSIGMRICISV